MHPQRLRAAPFQAKQLTGPEYAGRYIEMLRSTGVRVELGTMVLEVTPDKKIHCRQQGEGLSDPRSKERHPLPWAAGSAPAGRIGIPGTRPAGIYTAGAAQRYVNMEGYLVGKRVLILGSGDIGLIMARRMTLEGRQGAGLRGGHALFRRPDPQHCAVPAGF